MDRIMKTDDIQGAQPKKTIRKLNHNIDGLQYQQQLNKNIPSQTSQQYIPYIPSQLTKSYQNPNYRSPDQIINKNIELPQYDQFFNGAKKVPRPKNYQSTQNLVKGDQHIMSNQFEQQQQLDSLDQFVRTGVTPISEKKQDYQKNQDQFQGNENYNYNNQYYQQNQQQEKDYQQQQNQQINGMNDNQQMGQKQEQINQIDSKLSPNKYNYDVLNVKREVYQKPQIAGQALQNLHNEKYPWSVDKLQVPNLSQKFNQLDQKQVNEQQINNFDQSVFHGLRQNMPLNKSLDFQYENINRKLQQQQQQVPQQVSNLNDYRIENKQFGNHNEDYGSVSRSQVDMRSVNQRNISNIDQNKRIFQQNQQVDQFYDNLKGFDKNQNIQDIYDDLKSQQRKDNDFAGKYNYYGEIPYRYRNYEPYRELQNVNSQDQNVKYFSTKALKNLDNLKIY